jgi:hypothetical protein
MSGKSEVKRVVVNANRRLCADLSLKSGKDCKELTKVDCQTCPFSNEVIMGEDIPIPYGATLILYGDGSVELERANP